MAYVFRMWISHGVFNSGFCPRNCLPRLRAMRTSQTSLRRVLVASLLASVAALRAPGRSPVGGRAVVGRRFVLSAAALLAPPAATAATLSSQLAEATGLAAQLEANQNAPKAVAETEGNEADKRCATSLGIESVEH